MSSNPPPKDTVRKAVIQKFDPDPYKSIVLVSEPLQPPKRTEVQVAVLYAGFAGSEVNMSRGTYPGQPSPPFTPGYAMVGRVLSSGPSARRGFTPGDVVAALTVYGADAERINVEERHLVRVPAGVDPRVAAALPLDWCTALGLVEHRAKVQQGHKVFVHGLSGAVGQAATTLCLQKGATVYVTASARNHETLRGQGAHPFVYTDKAWITAMRELGGVDVVLDPLGYESFDESYSILATSRPSVLVGYGLNLRTMQGDGGKGRVVKPGKLETARQLAEIARLQAFNLKLWSTAARSSLPSAATPRRTGRTWRGCWRWSRQATSRCRSRKFGIWKTCGRRTGTGARPRGWALSSSRYQINIGAGCQKYT